MPGIQKSTTAISGSLGQSSGQDWVSWLGQASEHDPELGRAIQCLASLEEVKLQFNELENLDSLQSTKLSRPILRFVGQSRCPSAQACEKLAFRLKVLNGWLKTALAFEQKNKAEWTTFLLGSFQGLLERLFAIAEGADDKNSSLNFSVRQLTKDWLNAVAVADLEKTVRARWVFYAALSDVTGVIATQIWWPAIKLCDRDVILFLVEHEINEMTELQPSMAAGWKSYEKRWLRIRLKALLTELDETYLLSEVMRKSSVDDFEAAQALECLQKAGRHRLAISQGEKWQRLLPGSPVLAEALFHVYLHDGWDEEAEQLLVTQNRLDPDPKWLNLLSKYFKKDSFPDAGD